MAGKRTHLIDDETLLQNLKSELLRLDTTKRLKYDKLKDRQLPWSHTLMNRFNCNWNDLLIKIGLYKGKTSKHRTKEELLIELQSLADKLQRKPSNAEIGKCVANCKTIIKHFGSMKEALSQISVKRVENTPEELKSFMRKYEEFLREMNVK